MEENGLNFTEYERNLRKLYYVENAKRGLQNMEELNDALGRPLDNVSWKYYNNDCESICRHTHTQQASFEMYHVARH